MAMSMNRGQRCQKKGVPAGTSALAQEDMIKIWSGLDIAIAAPGQDSRTSKYVPSDKPVSPVPPHYRPHCRNLKH